MKIYDLAIIGGGPAGYIAAERAGAKGMSVLIFDMRSLGGVCLNEGCIPTKTLLNSAKVLEYAEEAGTGWISSVKVRLFPRLQSCLLSSPPSLRPAAPAS